MKKCIISVFFCFYAALTLGATPPLGSDVFKLKAKIFDPNTVSITIHIKEGFYLYRERIHVKAGKRSSLGPLRLPKALTKKDIDGNSLKIYRNKLQFSAALLNDKPGKTDLTVFYQGCSDGGFCYPPTQQSISLTVNKNLELSSLLLTPPTVKQISKTKTIQVKHTSTIETLFAKKNLFLLLLGFYGFGLLLSFTPCVLPMVPVLSGMIVGQQKTMTSRKAFFLSLSYVLSMSVTYAIAGLVIAAAGQNLQATLQAPWAVGIFSLVFILLAFSMFGFYELKLPDSWTQKLQGLNKQKNRGAYLGAVIMGVLSTLILSPCVTAPLVGALGYIANTGDMTLGGLSLLFLGFGMGTPLLLIGTSAGTFLPKTGPWMNAVKQVFGVLMLMIAVYLAERILPGKLTMFLWAALCIIPALYLGAFKKLTTKSNIAILCKGFGLMLFIYGILLLIGLGMGNLDPLEPLHREPLNTQPQKQSHQTLYDLSAVKKAISSSKGSPVLLDFYADWCASCKAMEKTIFTNPDVQEALNDVVWIKADVTGNTDNNIALEKYFNVIAPPSFIFINAQGEESCRIVGETDLKTFLAALKKAKN